MIISHKYKFIYVKTCKTASTSIETALTKICSEDDIITEAHEKFRRQRFRQAQNYRIQHPSVPQRPIWRVLLNRPERYYHESVGFYEHMPAWRIREYIGEDKWKNYFKFSFERNPWDRQVSFYSFKTRSYADGNKPSFQEFLKNKRRAFVDNWNLYTIDGEVALDFVGKYENLNFDFELAMKQIGVKTSLELPQMNKSNKDGKLYRTFYNERSKKLVYDWYKNEIEYFLYEF